MFMFLFDSRYPKKKTAILTLSTMIPLIIFNFILYIIYGVDIYTKLMLITLSLPSFVFFSILAKHRITAFSDQEEELLKSHTLVPYVLEDILTVMGARFERAKPWTSHVIRDDNFITGQNPQSAKELAEMVAQYLDAQN